MKRTRVVFALALGTALLLCAATWGSPSDGIGTVAQVTITPRPQLTPPPAGVTAASTHPPRLHGAVLNWGQGNMPGVKVVLHGDGWEIPVETDANGEYRFQDIGNEVAFLNVVVPEGRDDLLPLTSDLPVRVKVDQDLIVNLALYAKGITPETLLRLQVTPSSGEAERGGNVSFTITVLNTWDRGVNQVIVADYLPPGLEYVQATTSQGEVEWDSGLVWATLGPMPAGGTATVTIVARVSDEASDSSEIVNRVAAYHSDNVAVQSEATIKVVTKANGVLPVTGLSSILPAAGVLLAGLLFGIRRVRHTVG